MRVLAILLCAFLLAGCGSGSSSSGGNTATSTTSAGDIPDTANYLTYHGNGYALKYVEGWSILQGPGVGVTISDKDSAEIVAVVGSKGSAVGAYASKDLTALAAHAPKFQLLSKHTDSLPAGKAVHIQYHTMSMPDQVTGKRVRVLVDRYYIPGAARSATLTLSTPVGVDNVDAFRLIARSFRWQ